MSEWKHDLSTWKVTKRVVIEGRCEACDAPYVGEQLTLETPTASTKLCGSCWDLLLEDSPEIKAVAVEEL